MVRLLSSSLVGDGNHEERTKAHQRTKFLTKLKSKIKNEKRKWKINRKKKKKKNYFLTKSAL